MKYQISDLVNGPTGEIFTDKAAADIALKETIEEGKRMNLESSSGESDLGSNGMRVEDFISLVAFPDTDNGTLVHNSEVIYLQQPAYWLADGVYAATAKDVAGNTYEVRWYTTSTWDDACEAVKSGDETLLAFVEDEGDACDWDSPYSVEMTEMADD